MTDKIMEARRAKFEAWVKKTWPHMPLHRRDALPENNARFMEYVHFEHEWRAYNAALESLCVELPRAGRGSDGYPIYDAIATQEAIHAAGVKTR